MHEVTRAVLDHRATSLEKEADALQAQANQCVEQAQQLLADAKAKREDAARIRTDVVASNALFVGSSEFGWAATTTDHLNCMGVVTGRVDNRP